MNDKLSADKNREEPIIENEWFSTNGPVEYSQDQMLEARIFTIPLIRSAKDGKYSINMTLIEDTIRHMKVTLLTLIRGNFEGDELI